MLIRARIAVIAAVCGVCACTTPSHDPPASRTPEPGPVWDQPETAEVTSEIAARVVLPPTAEMLKAALANDPDAMRDAAALTGTCQAASTCPAQFGSCSNWSTQSLCNETCGASFCFCRPVRLCEGDPPEPRGVQTFNSFRVCFDPAHNACTEWTNTTTSFCGC